MPKRKRANTALSPLPTRLLIFAVLTVLALLSIRVIDGHVMQKTAEHRPKPTIGE